MSSLPINNTTSKRRLIIEPEEELEYLLEQKKAEISSEIQPTSTVASSEGAPKKARRCRPSKKYVSAESSTSEYFESANEPTPAFVAFQASSSINVSEFELALMALPMKVGASTVAAYRTPLDNCKDFCEKNRHRYPVYPQYPYTVEPTEFLIGFFKEFVFKRTYKKSVSVETDVRTQIGLQTEENESDQFTLLQIAENARSSTNGRKKIIEVPLGIEAVNQYKKVLMFLHEFQSGRREVGFLSPKKTYEYLIIMDNAPRQFIFLE